MVKKGTVLKKGIALKKDIFETKILIFVKKGTPGVDLYIQGGLRAPGPKSTKNRK